MSSYVTEFFLIEKYGVWALKRTFNHVHSTIQTTCTISYMAIRLYVEFWYISNFLQVGTRQQEMIWGHSKGIWKAWTSYFTPLNSLRPSELILNSCTHVHHITKLLKNRKFTYFEGHTVLRDEFLRHWNFFFIEKYGLSAFQRRVGCPHTIPRWFFTIIFVAVSKRLPKGGSTTFYPEPTLLLVSYKSETVWCV